VLFYSRYFFGLASALSRWALELRIFWLALLVAPALSVLLWFGFFFWECGVLVRFACSHPRNLQPRQVRQQWLPLPGR
jgi:hypothetical protein